VDVAAAQRRFVERGVWIRPFGRLVYVMPPYVIAAHELSELTAAIRELAGA
jgi:adenosylmethionine-8-amino-7-oxononanoate aminotransferase